MLPVYIKTTEETFTSTYLNRDNGNVGWLTPVNKKLICVLKFRLKEHVALKKQKPAESKHLLGFKPSPL